MSRDVKFIDSDRQLTTACMDLIETESDRSEVTFWIKALQDNEAETGSHVLRMQARQHLRLFKEKRKAKK